MINKPFALATLVFLSATNVHATLYNVTYTNNDGSQWTGIVDTITDSLMLTSWIEGAGDKSWWTPIDPTSIIFHAYQGSRFQNTLSSLTSYDVPDVWNGTIDANWGFLSDLGKKEILWKEGEFTGNNSRLAWGLAPLNNGNIDNKVESSLATEYSFGYVPASSDVNYYQVLDIGSGDTVLVTKSVVPIPSSVSLFGIGIAVLLGAIRPWKTLKRRETGAGHVLFA
ncbi:hypothetical protein ThidrDRAFT_3848 [Thiorhodococcus drewsii AZ1]|uniref:PEP motif anchor domain protein n=1 Tax=Thiorhodococcus drewsii AZ1 TaxID=765913 RepID=G2E6F4_9GAMM|nr:hypothetical protein [Thiorhodococcus drewsii]EGV28315.1 hypothetical protein ThidrDRAFT_3848 [Thiorhodococcus drewsii AZ1]